MNSRKFILKSMASQLITGDLSNEEVYIFTEGLLTKEDFNFIFLIAVGFIRTETVQSLLMLNKLHQIHKDIEDLEKWASQQKLSKEYEELSVKLDLSQHLADIPRAKEFFDLLDIIPSKLAGILKNQFMSDEEDLDTNLIEEFLSKEEPLKSSPLLTSVLEKVSKQADISYQEIDSVMQLIIANQASVDPLLFKLIEQDNIGLFFTWYNEDTIRHTSTEKLQKMFLKAAEADAIDIFTHLYQEYKNRLASETVTSLKNYLDENHPKVFSLLSEILSTPFIGYKVYAENNSYLTFSNQQRLSSSSSVNFQRSYHDERRSGYNSGNSSD